jgi:hypothetical protein
VNDESIDERIAGYRHSAERDARGLCRENLAQIKSAGVFKVGTEGTFPPLPIMIPPASWWGLMSTSRVKLPAGLA